ncbi:hypothetical protein Tco_1551106, partial [Tanacetum coccineum]
MALLLAEERFLKIKQTMREEQNQPGVMKELLLKLMDDLQKARNNFLKDMCTFLRKFSRIPFGITPKVILIAWESFGEIKDALMDKQYRQEDIQELMSKLLEDVRNISEEFFKYINCPSWNRLLFYFDDDDDEYIVIWRRPKAITHVLSTKEPVDSLIMEDENLDTVPAMESDEVIKSSVENLVPIPSEFEGISDDTSNVPNCDNNCESDLMESLINRDTLIVHSFKIDPIFEEFAGELAHIAPIPPGIVEADFDPNDYTSSDYDDFEDIEYVSLEEVNDINQEEKEFDLADILQIQDVILREKLLNVSRLISNIESLKDNPIPIMDSDSSETSLSFSNNSLPEFESFSNHTEETRSGSTTTHANYSLPEYESFHFDNLSLPRPPPEPPDVCLDMLYNDESFEPSGDENI